MWFGIVTLFPEMFSALNVGITGRAIKDGLLSLDFWNPRDFAVNKHKTVDAKPYGGGPGMLMMAEPLHCAIQAAKATRSTSVIYLSPQGKKFNQKAAQNFLKKDSIILVTGRYEGIDERVIEYDIDEEWSIGDYVLTGGELAAMVIIDAVTRLIPGAVGDQKSVNEDSLITGLLKYAQYTRPETLGKTSVPSVLVKGNHAAIKTWRLKQSLGKTWLRRPDLLMNRKLTEEETRLLAEFMHEFNEKYRKTIR